MSLTGNQDPRLLGCLALRAHLAMGWLCRLSVGFHPYDGNHGLTHFPVLRFCYTPFPDVAA